MSSNYPPGVTGNEPHIAGHDGCDLTVACEHTEPCECEPCECGCHDDGDDVDEFTEPDATDDGHDYDWGW